VTYPATTATYPTSMWFGFWFKSSKATSWGTGSSALKMLRAYSGSESVIPGLSAGEWSFFYADTGHLTGYSLPDTNWHSYKIQLTGASTEDGTDGVYRLWVAGVLQEEQTAVNWGGTSRNIIRWNDGAGQAIATLQGNLSGNYNGGAFTTCWDDFIIATTEAEIDAFVGADITAPILAEVTPVSTPSTDTTPQYVFSSDEAGTITYGGTCGNGTLSNAINGNNTTTWSLPAGTYSNCTVTVTDSSANASDALAITEFVITSTASLKAASGGVSFGGSLP